MLFGLACEGATDQITLENILCGYFEDENLADDIIKLQPPFDETTQKQMDGVNTGWTNIVLHYLSKEIFREDVLNNRFVIIQVDTDVSKRKGFDVAHDDENNEPLIVDVLIENVITKLIAVINSGEMDFYARYAEKIIFCISVHSLECWFYAYYNNSNESKIHDCREALRDLPMISSISKTYRNYQKISEPFLIRENINVVAAKDSSFRLFIHALAKIENQLNAIYDLRT